MTDQRRQAEEAVKKVTDGFAHKLVDRMNAKDGGILEASMLESILLREELVSREERLQRIAEMCRAELVKDDENSALDILSDVALIAKGL